MIRRVFWLWIFVSLVRCAAQDCTGAPRYTSEGLETRDAAECSLTAAPSCQRIRPAAVDAIFLGTVIRISESDGHAMLNGECVKTLLQSVVIKVDESLFGDVSGNVTVEAGDINGFYFRSRLRFLVFAHRRPDGSLTVTPCGGTKKLSEAKDDIAYLRSWNSRPPRTKLYGQAWIRVNKDNPERMVGFLGRALPRATVSISGSVPRSVTTDEQGRYELTDLPPGQYEVRIETPFVTYPSQPQRVDLVERGCAEVNFHVDPSSKQAARTTPN
jgi:hypothetical protein